MNCLRKIFCIIHNGTFHRGKNKIPPCPLLFPPSFRSPLATILFRPPLFIPSSRPLLSKGRCKKIGISPLTLPSPARGEGKHIEIRKKLPPPGGGRGRVGVIQGIISQLQGGWGDLRTVSLTLGLALLLSAIWGCDYARMNDQESVRTYKKEIPEMPPETIPITGGVQILNRANPKDLKNPFPYTQESVDQGKEAYFYFCVHCHGPKADGNGTVGQSFAPLPTNLTDLAVQKQDDGELFSKISLGSGRHPPLASTVSEPDRWAVVNYIRSLNKKPSS